MSGAAVRRMPCEILLSSRHPLLRALRLLTPPIGIGQGGRLPYAAVPRVDEG